MHAMHLSRRSHRLRYESTLSPPALRPPIDTYTHEVKQSERSSTTQSSTIVPWSCATSDGLICSHCNTRVPHPRNEPMPADPISSTNTPAFMTKTGGTAPRALCGSSTEPLHASLAANNDKAIEIANSASDATIHASSSSHGVTERPPAPDDVQCVRMARVVADGATVPANAVVRKGEYWEGNPATMARQLSQAERAAIATSASSLHAATAAHHAEHDKTPAQREEEKLRAMTEAGVDAEPEPLY